MGIPLQERIEKLTEMRKKVLKEIEGAIERHQVHEAMSWFAVLHEIEERL